MREIKFRAWDDEDKVMYKPLDFHEIAMADWEMESVDGDYTLPHSDWAYCENKTIWMQFTGLKDKNGKEIYEGDVVMLSHWKSTDLFDYSQPFEVTWQDGEIDFLQGEYHNFIGSMTGKLEIEVIGNVYENPELISDNT